MVADLDGVIDGLSLMRIEKAGFRSKNLAVTLLSAVTARKVL
jgi:hypothetical protein